jgi:hypothetical protein
MQTATPETDAKIFLMLSALQSGTQEVVSAEHARKLEIERDSARRVLEHCRLFILKRLGYHATEEMERVAIGAAINAILGENVEVSHGDGSATPTTQKS